MSLNENWVKNLENLSLRATQGEEATMRMGSNYPVLNASFAPIYNSSAISQVIQNNSFQAPFPSVSYEDLGVNLKAKAQVNGDSAISLHLEMQLRTLAGAILQRRAGYCESGISRQYDAEGWRTRRGGWSGNLSEQRSMTGIPGLGVVPGLNQIMTSNGKQGEEDELLIVLTPRIITQNAHTRPPKFGFRNRRWPGPPRPTAQLTSLTAGCSPHLYGKIDQFLEHVVGDARHVLDLAPIHKQGRRSSDLYRLTQRHGLLHAGRGIGLRGASGNISTFHSCLSAAR